MTQRVIDGKLYDTDNAERIASYSPNPDRGDFNFISETLYKSPNGRYFLHGEGGAATQYARSVGDGTTAGEQIDPMTTEVALEWCERREIDGEIVADEFDDEIEDA